MKIFVGTMACGEGDFGACCDAIASQVGVEITHKVISDLPEAEAHRQVYASWEDARSTHDIFVKIDADTVLVANDTLKTMCQLFKSNARLTGVQCYLNDYFTNSLIFGLNAYSSKIKLLSPSNSLFPDRVDPVSIHDIVLRGEALPINLQPAGYHCHRATDAQSFHYGLHRALKKQYDNLTKVRVAWEHFRDRPRQLVLEGAAAAPLFQKHGWGFNYTDDTFKAALAISIEKLSMK